MVLTLLNIPAASVGPWMLLGLTGPPLLWCLTRVARLRFPTTARRALTAALGWQLLWALPATVAQTIELAGDPDSGSGQPDVLALAASFPLLWCLRLAGWSVRELSGLGHHQGLPGVGDLGLATGLGVLQAGVLTWLVIARLRAARTWRDPILACVALAVLLNSWGSIESGPSR